MYSIEDNLKEVKTILQKNFELLQGWLYETHMVLNPKNCHYLVIIKDISNESIELGETILHSEVEQKPWYNNIQGSKLSKSYKVDHKNSQSKVKYPYQSRTVYD